MRISAKKTVEKEPLYVKKCPRCGHPARDHKLPAMYKITAPGPRTCEHPVPIDGNKDMFRICRCSMPDEYFTRWGNGAMICVKVASQTRVKVASLVPRVKAGALVSRVKAGALVPGRRNCTNSVDWMRQGDAVRGRGRRSAAGRGLVR
jgi:hypothetical protein